MASLEPLGILLWQVCQSAVPGTANSDRRRTHLVQIELKTLSKETGCTVLGKAEFQNPGGSVKDRAALYVVKDAEEKGR